MSQDDFAALRARVQVLEDRNAILDTLARYCQSVDYGDVDRLMDCFTDDAVREIWRLDGSVNRWEGVAGTRDFATRHTHAPDVFHKHLALNPLIELHGDTADVVSYMFRIDPRDGEPTFIWGMGRNLDTMRRDPDGRWRIQRRVTYIEDHWPGRSKPPAASLVDAGTKSASDAAYASALQRPGKT